MSDATKRTVNSSGSGSNSSKPRKSKSDLIRSTLGMYLKQRNYTVGLGVVYVVPIASHNNLFVFSQQRNTVNRRCS